MTDRFALWVGAKEISTRLRVKQNTVYRWQQRGLLPPPTGTVHGRDAWDWNDVRAWAIETNRMPNIGAPT